MPEARKWVAPSTVQIVDGNVGELTFHIDGKPDLTVPFRVEVVATLSPEQVEVAKREAAYARLHGTGAPAVIAGIPHRSEGEGQPAEITETGRVAQAYQNEVLRQWEAMADWSDAQLEAFLALED